MQLPSAFSDAVKVNRMPSLLGDSAAEAVIISAAQAVFESNVDPCVDPVTLLVEPVTMLILVLIV